MDSAIQIGPCSLASSSGMLVTSWDGLSPHRDHAISTNPSSGADHQLFPSSHCDSAHWVGTGDGLAVWLVAAGFECPTPWGTVNVPLAQALWFLLWLLSLWFP